MNLNEEFKKTFCETLSQNEKDDLVLDILMTIRSKNKKKFLESIFNNKQLIHKSTGALRNLIKNNLEMFIADVDLEINESVTQEEENERITAIA